MSGVHVRRPSFVAMLTKLGVQVECQKRGWVRARLRSAVPTGAAQRPVQRTWQRSTRNSPTLNAAHNSDHLAQGVQHSDRRRVHRSIEAWASRGTVAQRSGSAAASVPWELSLDTSYPRASPLGAPHRLQH